MKHDALVIASALGWVGALGTVAAYALVSRRRLRPESVRFQLLNLVGAAMLAASAMSHGNWSSAAANALWFLVGTHTVVQARDVLRPGAARHLEALRRTTRRTVPARTQVEERVPVGSL